MLPPIVLKKAKYTALDLLRWSILWAWKQCGVIENGEDGVLASVAHIVPWAQLSYVYVFVFVRVSGGTNNKLVQV